MARMIYASNMSLNGCTEDERNAFDRAPPDDDVFAFITELMRSAGPYLSGRRIYETMAVWETDSTLAAQSDLMANDANAWQAADKDVYSTTLPATPTGTPTSSVTSIRGRYTTRKPPPVGTSSWAAQTSQHRLLRPGWSTSSECTSGRSFSVGTSPHCQPAHAPTSSFSTSTDLATASYSSATAFCDDAGQSLRRAVPPVNAGISKQVRGELLCVEGVVVRRPTLLHLACGLADFFGQENYEMYWIPREATLTRSDGSVLKLQ